MKTHYSISIPKPCHQNWDKMIAEDKGKFCQSCSKSVIDFSQMTQQSIEDYLASNRDKKICDRFKSSQLATIKINIPQHIIEQQISFHKLFLLALLITMGTSLLNCSDQNGNSKKIDVVEVVDSLKTKSIPTSETTNPIDKIDTVSSKLVTKKTIIPPPAINGEVIKIVGDIAIDDEIVFGHIQESFPEFTNTPDSLSKSERKEYFSKHVSKIISENFKIEVTKNLGLKGKQRIFTQFKIDEKGYVRDITVRKSSHLVIEKEAIRVVSLLPRFIPAKQRHKNIATIHFLPIIFIVED